MCMLCVSLPLLRSDVEKKHDFHTSADVDFRPLSSNELNAQPNAQRIGG